MKHLLLIIGAAGLLTACGEDSNVEFVDNIPQGCTLENNVLTCPDGTNLTIENGKDGRDGIDGTNGIDGKDGKNGINGLNGAQGPKGDKGDTGAKGATGAQGPQGVAGTSGADGKDGINGTNGVDGKDGKDGEDGSEILYGPNDPDDGLDGRDGDTFVNTSTNDVFKKISGTWVLQTNIKGDQGLAGADGKNGVDGIDGVNGTNGLNGADGKDGKDGVNGTNGSDGKDGKDGKSCSVTDTADGAYLKCDDGTAVKILDGKDGSDGSDGKDGKDGINGTNGADGKDAVIFTSVKVKKNRCTQVGPNLWVENINNGEVFDVYYNPNCRDSEGEYCDNVLASFGDSGSVDASEHAGSGTTCWADNIQVQGHRQKNGDIIIKIMDFN